MADLLAQQLREDWASERIGENVHDTIPQDLEGEVGDEIPEESGSATDEGIPNNEHRPRQILKKARCTKYYVIVELPGGKFRLHKGGEEGCWMGRRRIFRNSREFSTRPDKSEYTTCACCATAGRLPRIVPAPRRRPGTPRESPRPCRPVVCDHCGLVQCNKRMWYALDTHGDCRPSGRGKGR